jgi:hypothetical protein
LKTKTRRDLPFPSGFWVFCQGTQVILGERIVLELASERISRGLLKRSVNPAYAAGLQNMLQDIPFLRPALIEKIHVASIFLKADAIYW